MTTASAPQQLRCPVLHAERLHDDAVWAAVQSVLTTVERGGGRMTLFVSPFWATVEGLRLDDRLAEIAARGHEIGQHTHYYDWSGQPASSYRKATVLADDNVRRCLDRDYAALVGAGVRPRGFVSGAWARPPALPGWLIDHGFAYDCTGRVYSDDAQPVSAGPGLLSVPTTHSLRRAVVDLLDGRLARHRIGPMAYALFYAHDYDLGRRGRAAMFSLVARWPGRGTACSTVGRLATVVTAGDAGPRAHG
jgi:hypothetical protein